MEFSTTIRGRKFGDPGYKTRPYFYKQIFY